ncbi:CAP domain-containing protein [Pararhodobacter aggregans]|uniref:CAP domain-containing protein n=1 Tax=Pararhodobacter aggregans TaxID=404875 RepID=UPI003A956F34
MMLRLALLLALLTGAPALACEVPPGLAGLRVELLNLANAERAAQGVGTLSPDPRLDEAAQVQACRMADRERLSHRGSWFAGLGRRLRRVDYPYAMAVENIGEGQTSAPEIIRGWMDSPDHRLNMLARDAREAGFGIARAANGRLHWSMVAAAPRF